MEKGSSCEPAAVGGLGAAAGVGRAAGATPTATATAVTATATATVAAAAAADAAGCLRADARVRWDGGALSRAAEGAVLLFYTGIRKDLPVIPYQHTIPVSSTTWLRKKWRRAKIAA